MTTVVMVSLSLKGGVPLSVTLTVTVLVLGACAGAGVQVNTPEELMAAPTGAPGSSVKVSVCGGWLVSVALAMKLSVLPPTTLRLPMGWRTGGPFGCWPMLAARGVGAGREIRLPPPSG